VTSDQTAPKEAGRRAGVETPLGVWRISQRCQSTGRAGDGRGVVRASARDGTRTIHPFLVETPVMFAATAAGEGLDLQENPRGTIRASHPVRRVRAEPRAASAVRSSMATLNP
jgi:hypothetical protein